MDKCKCCGQTILSDIDNAIELLKQDKRRQVYMARDGFFYVSYNPSGDIVLTREQVNNAAEGGKLVKAYLDRASDMWALPKGV